MTPTTSEISPTAHIPEVGTQLIPAHVVDFPIEQPTTSIKPSAGHIRSVPSSRTEGCASLRYTPYQPIPTDLSTEA
jgi:hypothetical protein